TPVPSLFTLRRSPKNFRTDLCWFDSRRPAIWKCAGTYICGETKSKSSHLTSYERWFTPTVVQTFLRCLNAISGDLRTLTRRHDVASPTQHAHQKSGRGNVQQLSSAPRAQLSRYL